MWLDPLFEAPVLSLRRLKGRQETVRRTVTSGKEMDRRRSKAHSVWCPRTLGPLYSPGSLPPPQTTPTEGDPLDFLPTG